jgi:hypothetical protein
MARWQPSVRKRGPDISSNPRRLTTDPCNKVIGRYKRVIGDALRSRTKGRQTTEVAIAVASLNRMLELGRPEYVRLT